MNQEEQVKAFEALLATDNLYDGVAFPSLVTRIKAVFLDLCIVLAVFATASVLIDTIGTVPVFVRGFIFVFMLYLYDPILTAFTGGTLGQKIMKIKVRRFSDPTKNISLLHSTVRFITKAGLGWISFFTVTGNSQRRAIHDMAGGSIVLFDK